MDKPVFSRKRSQKAVEKPTPRAIRWALDTLRSAFEPRDIPYTELRALQRFLEAQVREKS